MSTDELVTRIKEETPITAIVGRYVPIVQKGPNSVCLCPFHDDSNPSMQVNDSKKMFMCFVCGVGGDAIHFVRKIKNLNFVETLKDICSEMGWNYNDYAQEKLVSPRVLMAKKILSKAALIYRRVAKTDSTGIYEQFEKDRHFTGELASSYCLGLSPNNSVISEYLQTIPDEKDKSLAFEMAKEIGVIREDRSNAKSYYDTFRDRIMFPIWDQTGQVIGFTGRKTKEFQKAKYMNSIDSVVFNKKNILYGLHLAKSFIRQRDAVLLCEGNMDQIALYKHGFEHSVAIMGIALGDYSLKSLHAMTKNFYLCLDADQAGINAGKRINKQCLEVGVIPKFIDLTPHKDPDDFLESEGRILFQERIDNAKSYIDIEIEELIPEKIPELADRKLEILEKGFELVSPLKSSLLATERLVGLAKRLNMNSDASMIMKSYEDFLEKAKEKTKTFRPIKKEVIKEVEEVETNDNESLEVFNEPIIEELILSSAERKLIEQLVQHPDCLTHKDIIELLDFIVHDEVKRYVLKLRDLIYEIDESEYESVVSNIINSGQFCQAIVSASGPALFKYRPTALEDSIKTKLIFDIKRRLKEEQLKEKKRKLKEHQKFCETENDLNQLFGKLLVIEKQLNELKLSRPLKSE